MQITNGNWSIEGNPEKLKEYGYVVSIMCDGYSKCGGELITVWGKNYEDCKANAIMIVDAAKTYKENGMLPSEILKKSK